MNELTCSSVLASCNTYANLDIVSVYSSLVRVLHFFFLQRTPHWLINFLYFSLIFYKSGRYQTLVIFLSAIRTSGQWPTTSVLFELRFYWCLSPAWNGTFGSKYRSFLVTLCLVCHLFTVPKFLPNILLSGQLWTLLGHSFFENLASSECLPVWLEMVMLSPHSLSALWPGVVPECNMASVSCFSTMIHSVIFKSSFPSSLFYHFLPIVFHVDVAGIAQSVFISSFLYLISCMTSFSTRGHAVQFLSRGSCYLCKLANPAP